MDFRIEATTPTAPDALASALNAARDAWVEKTPQVHAVDSAEHKALQSAQDDIDQARLDQKGQGYPNALSKAVDRHAALIKSQNAMPTPDMAGALTLINVGIASAVDNAKALGCPVRASVFGHCNTTAVAVHGGYQRLCVTVDDAKLG
jgi:hypothetical protein